MFPRAAVDGKRRRCGASVGARAGGDGWAKGLLLTPAAPPPGVDEGGVWAAEAAPLLARRRGMLGARRPARCGPTGRGPQARTLADAGRPKPPGMPAARAVSRRTATEPRGAGSRGTAFVCEAEGFERAQGSAAGRSELGWWGWGWGIGAVSPRWREIRESRGSIRGREGPPAGTGPCGRGWEAVPAAAGGAARTARRGREDASRAPRGSALSGDGPGCSRCPAWRGRIGRAGPPGPTGLSVTASAAGRRPLPRQTRGAPVAVRKEAPCAPPPCLEPLPIHYSHI